MSKPSVKKIVLWVLFAAVVYWAVRHPYAEWRIRLLGMKLSGRLPEISWSQIPDELEGPIWFDRKAKPGDEHRGLVVYEREEEGACTHLWNTPMGDFWGRNQDESVLEWLVREQLIWSIYQNRWVSLQEGDVVLDVGSHLGVFTRMALMSGARKVVAFEPEPTNVECFKKTFKRELNSGEVVLVEAAAWDSVGTLNFTVEADSHESARARVATNGEFEVAATTIDKTVRRLNLERVDFVKMDIEGSEKRALAGARKTLQKFHPQIALGTYHGYDHADTLPKLVLEIQPEYNWSETLQYAYFY